MKKLVVTHIFGRTAALDSLVEALQGEVEVVDPYAGRRRQFSSQAEAYAAFTGEVGLDNYTAQLEQRIIELDAAVSVLGFSIGASAAWCIASRAPGNLTGTALFYSSQIRHFLSLRPQVPTRVIFACEEDQYSVTQVMQQLSSVLLNSSRAGAGHGFMNPASHHFDAQQYSTYREALTELSAGQCFSTLPELSVDS